MTLKERIIATAYTGFMFISGDELEPFYKYCEKKVGHGVIDIMFADNKFEIELRKAVRLDFLKMIGEK